MKSFINHGSL